MYRNDRPEDPDFDPQELLYRRYLQQHWINDHFSDLGFRFSDNSGQSVNRQKYSEPEDLLFFDDGTFDDDWGVLGFAVSGIPAQLSEFGTAKFVFFPKHAPEELNYAHSEVWCDKEKRTGEYVKPGKTIRKLFRTELSRKVSKIIEARK